MIKSALVLISRGFFSASVAFAFVAMASVGSSKETKVHVRGGKMETRMENGKVILTGLNGAVGGGQVEIVGNVGGDVSEPKNATIRFAKLPVKDAVQLVGKTSAPSWLNNVYVTGAIKGKWQGLGLKAIGQSAQGALMVETGPGEITDKAVLAKLAALLKVDELNSLKYQSIKVKARAAGGTLVIDELSARGPEFTVKAVGNYLARPDDLDLKIDLAVSQDIANRSTYLKLKNVLGIFNGGDEKPVAGELVEVPRLLVSGDLKKLEVSLDKTKPAIRNAKAGDNPAVRKTREVAFGERLKEWF